MGESAGRTDDLKELGRSHNILGWTELSQAEPSRVEPGRAGPGHARLGCNRAALGLCEGGSALVCSLTQGHLFLGARQLKQGRGGERANQQQQQPRMVTQEATHKFTHTSFVSKAAREYRHALHEHTKKIHITHSNKRGGCGKVFRRTVVFVRFF